MSAHAQQRVPSGRMDILAYRAIGQLVEQSGDPALIGWHSRFAPAIESLAREYLGPLGLSPEDDDEDWDDELDEDELDEDEDEYEDDEDERDEDDDDDYTCSSRPRGPVIDAEFVAL